MNVIKKYIPIKYKKILSLIIFKISEKLYFKEVKNFSDIHLIAHAGGGIDGFKYTNSLEAFMKNYDNDFIFLNLIFY